MKIIIIVAMTKDRLIGRGGRLPWHDSEDLKHFKRTTSGHAVIMGRRTWESIGRPLPDRRNIVISRQTDFRAAGADVVHSLQEAIDLCRQRAEEQAFIIGGAQLYEQALPMADEMIVTSVEAECRRGDTFFPPWDESEWSSPQPCEGRFPRARRYVRRRPATP